MNSIAFFIGASPSFGDRRSEEFAQFALADPIPEFSRFKHAGQCGFLYHITSIRNDVCRTIDRGRRARDGRRRRWDRDTGDLERLG